MNSDIITKNPDATSVSFIDLSHDVLCTTGQGLVRGVREIRISNQDEGLSNGRLCIRINGDPLKCSVSEMTVGQTSVTAIAYADLSSGIMRAGSDPKPGDGEVILILLIDANIPDSTMARAGITATEGITVAVQDLGLHFDGMPASGSLRQNVVVVSDRDSELFLRGAGKHTKLGELIGRTTIEAVKSSAEENGTSIVSHMSISGMLSDYGYDRDSLYRLSGCEDMSLFIVNMLDRDSDPVALATVSSAIHIYNEVQWGLVSEEVGARTVAAVLGSGLGIEVEADSILRMLASTVARYLKG